MSLQELTPLSLATSPTGYLYGTPLALGILGQKQAPASYSTKRMFSPGLGYPE